MPGLVTSTIEIEPFPSPAKFGVFVRGIDLNTMTEQQFKELELAIYTHKVVVVKDQKNLEPATQQNMAIKFDKKTPAKLGHMDDTRGKKTIFGAPHMQKKPTMPTAWLVNLNGSAEIPAGYQGIDHPFTLKGLSHRGFHRDELSQEESDAGKVRFQRWHQDAPMYKNWPARITLIWAHQMPSGDPVKVCWDDGEGSGDDFVMSAPGRTAFFDCAAMYNSFTPEQKKWVDHSLIEYAPSPCQSLAWALHPGAGELTTRTRVDQWLAGAKCQSNGLTMFSEGNETPLENIPDLDYDGAQTMPMTWVNPVTGEKAFQVHGIIAYKIHYRESADAPYKIIDDLTTVRQMIHDLQRPFVVPENIVFAPAESGDMLCFYNRGVRHSAVEFPPSRGDRILHQCQLIASDPPFDPAPIEGLPFYKEVVSAA